MLPIHWQRKSKLKKTSLKRRYAISGHFTFANVGDISKWSRYFSFPLYTKSSKSHLRKISPIVHVWMRKPWSYFASKLDQRRSIWQGSDRFCHNPVENVQRLSGRSSPLRGHFWHSRSSFQAIFSRNDSPRKVEVKSLPSNAHKYGTHFCRSSITKEFQSLIKTHNKVA